MKDLHVTIAGHPPMIRVSGDELSPDAWLALSLALGARRPALGEPLHVRPSEFLRHRARFVRALRDQSLRPILDRSVRELLTVHVDDERALAEAVDNPDRTADLDAVERQVEADGRSFIRDLRRFQRRDFGRLLALRHGANFSVPGAGKTTVAYALHAAERARDRVDCLLVIAPLSAFGAWEEDATEVVRPGFTVGRWRGGDFPDTDVVVTNYQRLPTGFADLAEWMVGRHVHLVVDEAHRAKKGQAGEWGRALQELGPLAARRDILTGTPAPNHPKDLKALLDFLWPSEAASRRLPRSALVSEPPRHAMADVNDAIAPLFVRTQKAEMELPNVDFCLVRVPMGRLQARVYRAMLGQFAEETDLDIVDEDQWRRMGAITMYLIMAASSPRLLADNAAEARFYAYPSAPIALDTALVRLLDSYADHEVPPKIARACEIVAENWAADPPRKTLVWSNFPANLRDMQQQLAALQPAVVYGGVASHDDPPEGVVTREMEIERFRHDPNCGVLLANPAAMAEGISLHLTCHDAIYVDRTFNAGIYLQSLDRIHRLGLAPETETRVTLLVAENTIDERIHRRVAAKAQRLALMLRDPRLVQMSLPDDDDIVYWEDDSRDLHEVLKHLREGRPGDFD